jgi:large subunit ribosomal protein L22
MEAIAKLRNVPTSPRKARLVADLVRGKQVFQALSLLKYQPQHSAITIGKVLRSAIANYEQKFPELGVEDLYIKHITVDEGRMLKRIQPAPQGRAHRIRKRSNHITIIVANLPGSINLDMDANNELELSTANQ